MHSQGNISVPHTDSIVHARVIIPKYIPKKYSPSKTYCFWGFIRKNSSFLNPRFQAATEQKSDEMFLLHCWLMLLSEWFSKFLLFIAKVANDTNEHCSSYNTPKSDWNSIITKSSRWFLSWWSWTSAMLFMRSGLLLLTTIFEESASIFDNTKVVPAFLWNP